MARAPVLQTVDQVTRSRFLFVVLLLAILLLLAIILAPLIGPTSIDFQKILDSSTTDSRVFFVARLPRILLAAIAGAALAVGGLVFQSVLRNPIATPYTLGVASGASLGAVISIRWGFFVEAAGISSLVLSAFAGASVSMAVLYLLSKKRRYLRTTTMLLVGVAMSFLFSSLILFIHYVSDFTQSYQMLRWMMGGLDIIDYRLIGSTGIIVVCCLFVLFFISRSLNLLSVDEELAATRGVDVFRTKRTAYIASSLMIAAVVSMAGPIGFVGLVVPHVLRIFLGADNRILLPASALLGGSFLIVCDTFARTAFTPAEVPVGIITALIGSPFFLWLLTRNNNLQ
jgi:iron complex transport system permease protein